jgi:chaperonin GroEL
MGGGNIEAWINTLKLRKDATENKWEKDLFNERIAKLQNGIAVIKVGASSDTEVKYLKLKIEDGVNETKRALEEGVVVGGNCAYINAVKMFSESAHDFREEAQGYTLVLRAVEAPLRQIVLNSDGSPDVVINRREDNKSLTVGYDSLDNEIVDDMYTKGIIDAVKVPKTVLQNAVSAASMFLSIESAIAEELNEK